MIASFNQFANKELLAIASVAVGTLANFPYVIAIIKGHRPPYTTYFGWFMIGIMGFIFHFQSIDAASDKWSALFPALFAAIPFAYLGLLISLGAKWRPDRRDKTCLYLIAVSWTVWVTGHLSGFGTIFLPLLALIATDAFASWPILQNAWRGDESNPLNRVSWFLTTVASALGASAVAAPSTAEMIYPGYLLVMMWAIFMGSILTNRSRSVTLA